MQTILLERQVVNLGRQKYGQHKNPEEATESGKDHLRAAAGDI
jgi:hypothetical protein